MAIISDSDVTTFIRELLGESTEKHWSDSAITLYKKFGMIAVLSKYWYMLAPTEVKVVATSLTANQAYVTIPTDSAKVLKVEVASDGKLLGKIEVNDLWKYELYDDGAAATNYLNIHYLEYYDVVTDFPEALRPLIALEAVMYAKTKDDDVDAGFLRLYRTFEENAITFLATDAMYEPSIFGDDELADAYTADNPVAWSFRAGKIYLFKMKEFN